MPKIVFAKKGSKTVTKEPDVEEYEEAEEDMFEAIQSKVEAFNNAADDVNNQLISRADHVAALKLCIVSRHNLLLLGSSGTAKSMLARAMFSRISDARFYHHQFMKGTLVDEVFGPMRAKKYKEEEIFEYNIKGMLPDAHFANCDELYRGPDSLLDGMLQILNERTFHNGAVEIQCPLITAIGTTNFITESEELEAFHDRWLVRMKVKPLEKSKERISAMEGYLHRRRNGERSEVDTVSLEDVQAISLVADQVLIDDSVLELYDELLAHYLRNMSNRVKITDRRMCQTLSLVQAGYVLSEERPKAFEAAYLVNAAFGLCNHGDEEQMGVFTNAFEKVVGDSLAESKLAAQLSKLGDKVDAFEGDYDENMPKKDKMELYKKVKKFQFALNNRDPSQQPKTVKTREKLDRYLQKLAGLAATIENSVGIEDTTDQGMPDEMPIAQDG